MGNSHRNVKYKFIDVCRQVNILQTLCGPFDLSVQSSNFTHTMTGKCTPDFLQCDCPPAACDRLGRAETAAYGGAADLCGAAALCEAGAGGEAAGSVGAPAQNSGSPAAASVVTRKW